MTTMQVDDHRTTGTPGIGISAATSNVGSQAAGRHMPLTMPVDDVLYWSLKWRVDTKESEAARARGQSVVFDSNDPLDAVRWLFSEQRALPDDRLTPVEIDEAFKKRLAKKPHKSQEAIARAIVKLRQDARRPGLRTHKLQGMPGVIAARVSEGDRLTFRWDGDRIVLLNHCTHSQVYGR